MRQRAFTLIELLIVIIVIGLLAAILIPAFVMAREAGKRAVCANNLRQIGVAWYLYLDDHGETFPPYGFNARDRGEANDHSWGGKSEGCVAFYSYEYNSAEYRVLNKYLDVSSNDNKAALEIFHCPGDRVYYIFQSRTPTRRNFDYSGNSYTANRELFGLKLSYITATASKLAMVIEDWNLIYNMGTGEAAEISYHGGKDPYRKENVLFLDGHVKMHNNSADYDLYGTHDPSKDVYWQPVPEEE